MASKTKCRITSIPFASLRLFLLRIKRSIIRNSPVGVRCSCVCVRVNCAWMDSPLLTTWKQSVSAVRALAQCRIDHFTPAAALAQSSHSQALWLRSYRANVHLCMVHDLLIRSYSLPAAKLRCQMNFKIPLNSWMRATPRIFTLLSHSQFKSHVDVRSHQIHRLPYQLQVKTLEIRNDVHINGIQSSKNWDIFYCDADKYQLSICAEKREVEKTKSQIVNVVDEVEAGRQKENNWMPFIAVSGNFSFTRVPIRNGCRLLGCMGCGGRDGKRESPVATAASATTVDHCCMQRIENAQWIGGKYGKSFCP